MNTMTLPEHAEVFDISLPIFPGMTVFPGDPDVLFHAALDMGNGDPANVTCLHLGSQTGTHYDAPHHILNNGVTLEHFPLDHFFGPARVVAIPESVMTIDAALLRSLNLDGVERLLLKTRNSRFWQDPAHVFQTDYTALTTDAAEYLAGLDPLLLVGIDYLSIECYGQSELAAHKALMHRKKLILEGINLNDVTPGDYTLVALPLAYRDLDGGPTRAMLLRHRNAG